MRRLVFSVILLALPCTASPLDLAFDRLYDLDFAGANRLIDQHVANDPADPLSYAVRASALLFQELDRLQILEGEFFADDKRLIDKRKIKADPGLKDRFFKCIAQAQKSGEAKLAANPQDADALFTMALASGLTGDYSSLIEKRQLNSFSYYKEATGFAQRLLKAHPSFVDANLTTGFSEYLLGSLPFFAKWFVKIDGIEGSKLMAAEKMKSVARSGRYLKPFAKILLSIYYLREDQPSQARSFLTELSRDYPNNPLFKKELSKLDAHFPK
ncbi:MAG: hypothetical protein ABJF23_03150 [Bryobacteraceae bacterium]